MANMKDNIRKKLNENFSDGSQAVDNYNENETFEINKQIFDALASMASNVPMEDVARMTDSQKKLQLLIWLKDI